MKLRSMRNRLSVIGMIALIVSFASLAIVAAQTGPSIPAIINFSSTLKSTTLAEVEAGDASTTLSWYIVNVAPGDSVALEYWVQNGWYSLSAEGESLEPVGSLETALLDPISFSEPTFRLSLVRGGNTIDQRFVVVGYNAPTADVSIDSFTTDIPAIDPGVLNLDDTRILVSWTVSNRPLFSNLVFEQVLSETEAISVELSRGSLYIPSFGQGPVAPVNPGEGANAVTLRLSIISALDGSVFTSEDLVIPIAVGGVLPDAPAEAETVTETTGVTETEATSDPETIPAEGGETTTEAPVGDAPVINTFSVNPGTVPPGGNVTMAWNVTGATSIQIQEVVGGVTGVTYIQLPPLGAVQIPVPANATQSVVYILNAASASGSSVVAEQTVTIGQ